MPRRQPCNRPSPGNIRPRRPRCGRRPGLTPGARSRAEQSRPDCVRVLADGRTRLLRPGECGGDYDSPRTRPFDRAAADGRNPSNRHRTLATREWRAYRLELTLNLTVKLALQHTFRLERI